MSNPKTRKNLTFSQLESLIQQAKREGNKTQLVKYKSLVKLKEKSWANSLLAGQQKLFEHQKYRRSVKQAQINKELAQQARKERLGEIYSYFRRELNKENHKTSPYFTAHLDLEPTLAKALAKKQKEVPDYDFYAEFKKNKKHLTYKLNKQGQTHLLQQTQKLYKEELDDQRSQIRYYQERAGLTKVKGDKLIIKGQEFKFFFPDKGEHKDFFKRTKEFKQLWREIKKNKSDSTKALEVSKKLYEKSPNRIRDRNLQVAQEIGDYLVYESDSGFVAHRKPPPDKEDWNVGAVFKKYYKESPFTPTKKHYRSAIREMLRKPLFTGEAVPESEIELSKKDPWPVLKEGQVMSVDISNAKPGRQWSIRKNVPTLKQIIKEKVHEVAHQAYIDEYGTEMEKQTYNNIEGEKALCRIEAVMGHSCSEAQGTSQWWCLFCIYIGEYHPPVLPKHCSWTYTYQKGLCGSNIHSDANKQWHWSTMGEKTRAWTDDDWGGCHIATYGKVRRDRRRKI
ncbi:MAG: hypothetical protein mread185_000312 [Mycoplasmataceae bacterium]|nr:MAG: hypothetical protein mread185_000312 [Mycoplasmataceae bacterium]